MNRKTPTLETPFGLSLSKPSLPTSWAKRRGGLRQAQPERGRGFAVLLIVLALSTPATARENLGVHEDWAAFRDTRPPRCFAIAEPIRPAPKTARWRPFASIAAWPALKRRNQLHIRLRHTHPANSRATLTIGRTRFPLMVGGADAWALDPRADAAIVAAMRSADAMTVSARGFTDRYRLRGAATAIDAATLGCGRR